MLRLICTITLLVAGTEATERVIHGGNDVFDLVVEKLNDLDDIRVMPLDDIKMKFKLLQMFGTEAKLHDGVLIGIDTMQRLGNASVDFFDDKSVVVKGSLAMGVVEFGYRGTVKVLVFKRSIEMRSHVGYITVDTELTYDGNGHVNLTKFKIRDFEGLRVRFTGLGVLTVIANLFIDPVMAVFKPIIKTIFEARVKTILEKKLPALLDSIDLNS